MSKKETGCNLVRRTNWDFPLPSANRSPCDLEPYLRPTVCLDARLADAGSDMLLHLPDHRQFDNPAVSKPRQLRLDCRAAVLCVWKLSCAPTNQSTTYLRIHIP